MDGVWLISTALGRHRVCNNNVEQYRATTLGFACRIDDSTLKKTSQFFPYMPMHKQCGFHFVTNAELSEHLFPCFVPSER
ncbi:hypothetical protein A0J61_11886 [Choanephora cucurbitarum]|uniref:Uncharacterized protein n=1 Tax=Choanephora cucurbitarum TaxID=101091 RepID=A0A1C7M437_9FUNG|nr:hypothetical protein A0J61_11886 [Choanephora cucurbitarum]